MKEVISKKCLVTGGAGFIGSHLVEELVALGHSVTVLDNLSYGQKENLLSCMDKIEFVEGSIENRQLMEKLAQGKQVVFHQAALSSVPMSVKYPQYFHDVNVNGCFNVLEAAKNAGVEKVIMASSASVYKDHRIVGKRQHEDDALEPKSPYASSKLINEFLAKEFSQNYGLETYCLRYFNVFGPRQTTSKKYDMVVPKFCSALLNKEPLTVYGDGKQTRDYVFVKDVVQANLKCMEKSYQQGENHVYNVASDRETTILELIQTLEKISNQKIDINYYPPRQGDNLYNIACVDKFNQDMNFKCQYSLEEGLTMALTYYYQGLQIAKAG